MKSSLTAVLASASVAAAHMEMTWPPPFRSKFNPYSLSSAIDYTMTAPLLADGSNYPCKKYQVGDLGTPQGRPTASFAAGQSANVTIGGGAPHGGGSCQVSLSYDRGETFTVVQSIEGGCPASAGSTSLNFAIPYDAPQGDALLAWTWFNNLGNREMYMNCAAVTITGNSGKRDEESAEKRGARGPMNSRPKLFVANVGNGCSTVDSRDVQFPQPGPDLDVKSAQGAVAPRGSGCQSSVSGTAGNVDYAVASPNAQAETPAAASPAPASSSAAPAAQNSPQPAAPAPAPAAAAPANSVGTVGSDAAGLSSLASSSSSSSSGSSSSSSTSSSSSANGATTAGTPCTSEGRWACLAGGRSFQRCASGQWSAVQAMAPGTVCRLGQSDNKFEIETAPVAVASRAETSRARLRQLLRSRRGG